MIKKNENVDVQEPAVEETQTAPATLVYCGPSVRNVVRQYTVFTAGIPAPLEAFLAAHPAARGLLVRLDQFAETRKKLETAGTAEAILYKVIQNEI